MSAVKLSLLYICLMSLHVDSSHALWDELYGAVQQLGSFMTDIGHGTVQVINGLRFVQDLIDSTIEEDCQYKCRNGYIAVNNTDHVMSSNGCGSLGIKWERASLPVEQLTDCCDGHDFCYDTCGTDKDLCDLRFKKCLYQVCQNRADQMDRLESTACKAAAKLLYTGTLALGCKSFRDAQKQACRCVKQPARTPHTEL